LRRWPTKKPRRGALTQENEQVFDSLFTGIEENTENVIKFKTPPEEFGPLWKSEDYWEKQGCGLENGK